MAKRESFDWTVTKINKKGQVVQNSPYRIVIKDGTKKMERPPGSGIWFDASGKELPREKSAKETK